jgi:hypothetical protein
MKILLFSSILLVITLIFSCNRLQDITDVIISSQKNYINKNIPKSERADYMLIINSEKRIIPVLLEIGKFETINEKTLKFNFLIARTEVTGRTYGKIWNCKELFFEYKLVDNKFEVVLIDSLKYFSRISHIVDDVVNFQQSAILQKSSQRTMSGGSHFIYTKVLIDNGTINANSFAFYEYPANMDF